MMVMMLICGSEPSPSYPDTSADGETLLMIVPTLPTDDDIWRIDFQADGSTDGKIIFSGKGLNDVNWSGRAMSAGAPFYRRLIAAKFFCWT